MATANHDAPDRRYDEQAHPVFLHAFDAQTRRSLIDDDLMAGRSVSGVLVSIVTLGLGIGLLGCLLSL